MDSITQAVLGAAIGEAVLGKKVGRAGAATGAVVATLPDLDIFLYAFYDKFSMLSIHRGYSHSLVGSLLGAILLVYVLKKIRSTKEVSYRRLWFFSWLALFTHALLDTFTAYGTQLFLPFSNARAGFDSINIIDPFYTVPLIIGLIFALFVRKNEANRSKYNTAGLLVSSFYLLVTLGVKQYVVYCFETELAEQNIDYNDLLTMPVGTASIDWYGVAKTEEDLYMHKYSLLKNQMLPFEYFPVNEHLLKEMNSEAAECMKWFAKGFYVVRKHEKDLYFYNLQVDMRGPLDTQTGRVPTTGYFIITPQPDGDFLFSSGTHTKSNR